MSGQQTVGGSASLQGSSSLGQGGTARLKVVCLCARRLCPGRQQAPRSRRSAALPRSPTLTHTHLRPRTSCSLRSARPVRCSALEPSVSRQSKTRAADSAAGGGAAGEPPFRGHVTPESPSVPEGKAELPTPLLTRSHPAATLPSRSGKVAHLCSSPSKQRNKQRNTAPRQPSEQPLSSPAPLLTGGQGAGEEVDHPLAGDLAQGRLQLVKQRGHARHLRGWGRGRGLGGSGARRASEATPGGRHSCQPSQVRGLCTPASNCTSPRGEEHKGNRAPSALLSALRAPCAARGPPARAAPRGSRAAPRKRRGAGGAG